MIPGGNCPKADLVIAAVAATHRLPLFTTDPGDFAGIDDLVTAVPGSAARGQSGRTAGAVSSG